MWPEGYATGVGWIDGFYVATASHMYCGQGSACGTKHSTDCGHCYEVKCTGTDTNTDGYQPCTDKTVTVAVTDECPGDGNGGPLCSGAKNHFDLSTKAFNVIGNEKAGVIHIEWRQVACPVGGRNLKLVFLGNQWWFRVGAKDVGGTGYISKFEVKTSQLGAWTMLDKDYGQFWKKGSYIGDGPFNFRLTAEDGQQLTYDITGNDITDGTIDIGANFA